jgi:IS30 family transposase
MTYRQITYAERYTLGLLRQRGLAAAAIARILHRHPSTIGREVRRNHAHSDGTYRPQLADSYARCRRSRSRRNRQFTPTDWAQVQELLREDWSPDQVAGWLRRFHLLDISHETIYRYIWADKRAGGTLFRHLRGARKQRRKRYGRYDSRGRLAGKRWITERPAVVDTRQELGHWEADTMLGDSQAGPCVLSLVERKTGYLLLGQLRQRLSAAVNQRAAADQSPTPPGADHHRGQRHRVSRVRRARASDRDGVLLRHAASRLGAGHQRKHQWSGAAVSAQAPEHGPPHPKRVQSDRYETEPPTAEATRLSHSGGMLCGMTLSVALQS